MCENKNESERGLADNEETQEIWAVSESFTGPHNRPMKIFRSKQFAEQYMKEFYVEYLEIAAYRLASDSKYLKMFNTSIDEAGETIYTLNETMKTQSLANLEDLCIGNVGLCVGGAKMAPKMYCFREFNDHEYMNGSNKIELRNVAQR